MSHKLKLLAAAYDVGGKNVWEPVVSDLVQQGNQAEFLNLSGADAGSWREKLADCTIFGVTPSSFERELEHEMVEEAVRSGKRIVLLADMPNSQDRLAVHLRSSVDLFFAATPQMAESIGKQGIRKDCIFYLGPPPHWAPIYFGLKEAPRVRDIFSKMEGGINKIVYDDDIIVHVTGTKDLEQDGRLVGLVRAFYALSKRPVVLYYGIHPALVNEDRVGKEAAAANAATRDAMLSKLPLLDPEGESSRTVMANADMVVFTGGSTDSIAAAYVRLPAVYFYDKYVIERNKRQGMHFGEGEFPNGRWFVPDMGGSLSIEGPDAFIPTVRKLMTVEGRRALTKGQEKNFPPPPTWDTAPSIIEHIKRLAAGARAA